MSGFLDSFLDDPLGRLSHTRLLSRMNLVQTPTRVSSPSPLVPFRNSASLFSYYTRNLHHSWYPHFPFLCICRWPQTAWAIPGNQQSCVKLPFINKWILSKNIIGSRNRMDRGHDRCLGFAPSLCNRINRLYIQGMGGYHLTYHESFWSGSSSWIFGQSWWCR